MALALYRKYRPRTFAEVIGQEHVTEPLSQALRSGRLHHAYLFSGPRGCGKTSSARILARSLNCEQGPTPEPCGVCDSCRSLANDGTGSIDVIEIDAASHGGVDDARELRERAFFAPVGSRYKIYVIDEAHMVSTQGFNALLKLVEEPPEYVKFIFATTEPEKVLGTIRSRTHHYPFRLIPPAVLRPFLEQLCQSEGVPVEPSVFPLVVRAGAGSARDSLSVLDQLIAGAGPEGVNYARAVALLGVTDAALIDEMCDALAAGDGAAAYATVDRVAEAGHDPRRFASDLLERLRDLIILRQVPDAVAKGLIDGPTDQIERMEAQAQRLGPATLSRCADIVHNGLVEMRGTTGPRLLLELVCARMLLPGADDSSGALLQRLERLERGLPVGAGADQDPGVRAVPVPAPTHAQPAPPSPAPVSPAPVAERGVPGDGVPTEAPVRRPVPAEAVMPDPATPDPAPPGAASGGVFDATALRLVWRDVVETVKATNKRMAALVNDATVSEVTGQTVVLTFRYPVHAQMVAGQLDVLVAAFRHRFGGSWDIRCEVAGDRRAAGPEPSGGDPAGAGGGGGRGGPAGAPVAPVPAGPVPAQAQQPGPPQPTAGRPGTAAPSAGQPTNGHGPGGHAGDGHPMAAHSTPVQPAAPQRPMGHHPVPERPGPGQPAAAQRSAVAQRQVGQQPGAQSPGPGLPAGQAADEDWPETARPGGAAPSGTATATVTAQATGAIGQAVTAVAAPPRTGATGTAPGRAGFVVPARGSGSVKGSGPAVRAESTRAANGVPARGSGGAPEAAGGGPAAGRRAVPHSAGAAGSAVWDDGPPPDEPPFDPDYDGFDPGDEPLDDVLDTSSRQSGEEQALQLLREKLGAEKIGEIDAG